VKNRFDYYYGSQSDQFSFIRIPKIMLTDQSFAALSMQAKVLYGVLLDRMSLSRKNSWFDEQNRVFIIYQIGEIQEDLGFSKKKAMELLSELENFGLLEKKRRGHGLPNILYVKSFMDSAGGDLSGNEAVPDETATGKIYSRGAEKGTSGPKLMHSRSANSNTLEVPKPALLEVPQSAPLEVPILGPLKSNTNINKTEENKIESNHIRVISPEAAFSSDRCYVMRYDEDSSSLALEYRSLICENIEFDNLLLTFPERTELLEGIVELILETLLCRSKEILISSTLFPAEIVRNKFLKLDYSHIVYVVTCFTENTTKVKNIRKYLLASLYNAPTTIEGYYTAEVNHDLARAR